MGELVFAKWTVHWQFTETVSSSHSNCFWSTNEKHAPLKENYFDAAGTAPSLKAKTKQQWWENKGGKNWHIFPNNHLLLEYFCSQMQLLQRKTFHVLQQPLPEEEFIWIGSCRHSRKSQFLSIYRGASGWLVLHESGFSLVPFNQATEVNLVRQSSKTCQRIPIIEYRLQH